VARTLRVALAGLSSSQKTIKGAPAYSRFVNRRLGRYLGALAYVVRLTPNQVTAISATATAAGILLIALLPPSGLAAGAIVLLLLGGYALDSADGQLARLLGGGTLAGEWLDHVVDAAKVGILHLAVFVHFVRFVDAGPVVLGVPLAYEFVASTLFFAMILTEQLRKRVVSPAPVSVRSSSRLYALAVIPTDYGVLCLAFGLLWWQTGFVVVYAALLLANAAFLLLALAKWFGELKRT
jgi:phosphatidylglycerophosphate synthase